MSQNVPNVEGRTAPHTAPPAPQVNYHELIEWASRGEKSAVVCCNSHCLCKEFSECSGLVLDLPIPKRRSWSISQGRQRITHGSGGQIIFINEAGENVALKLRGLTLAKVVRV